MAIRKLTVEAALDAKGIKKGASEARAAFGQMESAGSSMGKALKNSIGAIGFGALIVGVKKAMDAQAQQIDAVNKLNVALANQGNFTKATSQSLQDYASSLQKVTTYGDEAILNLQAQLASYGGTEEQIKRTTMAVLDMAAATGTDLKAAGDLMGKAMVGYTGTLSRYGIIIDENVPKSERFEAALSQVEQRFAGQAQVAAQNYAGAMKQLGNVIGDLWEAFGKLFGYMAGQGDKPFAGLIKALQWLVDFISRDVILTIGEFRAKFAEGMAAIMQIGAKAFDILAKLPGEMGAKFQGYADTLKLAAADQRLFAEEQRVAAVQAAYTVGKVAEVTNGTKQLTEATRELTEEEKKAAEEAKKFAEAVEKMAQSFTGAFDPQDVKLFSAALGSLESAGQVAADQLETVAVKILDMKAAGIELPPIADEIVARFAEMTNVEAAFQATIERERELQAALDSLGPTVEQVSREFDTLGLAVERFGGLVSLSDAQLEKLISQMEELALAGKLTDEQWEKLGAAYTESGRRAQEAGGKLKDATKASFDWSKALQDVSNQFQGMPGIIGEVASLIGNIAQQVAGIGASWKSVQSGFAAFKGAGGGFLGKLGGIASMIPGIGGLIGGVTSIFGGIKKLFGGKSKEEKAAEEARKKAWEDLSATLEEQYGSLSALREQAAKYGVDLSKAMDTKDAEEMNKQLKELEKRQKGLKDAAAGISKVIENIKPTTEAGAMAQAGLFSTVFWATVEREGLMAASESLRGAFDTLMEGASAAMQEFLAPIATQMNLAANEAFAAAAEGAAGLAQAIKGMADAGIVSIQDMTNAGQVAMDAYNQALAAAHQEGLTGAAAQEAAIRAVGPAVAAIKQQYEALGLPIDANTAALIGQAEAAGMAFATDPMTRAANAMEAVAVALDKAFGLSLNLASGFGKVASQAGAAASAAGSIPGPPGPGGGGPPAPYTGAQKGLAPQVLGTDMLIQAHKGEGVVVVPRSKMHAGMGFASAQGGIGGSTPGPKVSSHRAAITPGPLPQFTSAPTIVIEDKSLVRTAEGVRQFRKQVVTNIYKALDQNTQGLATRMEYQQRTQCRSRI